MTMKIKTKTGKLFYRDSDGLTREVRDCSMTVDELDRHWIWSKQLQHNIVYERKGRENALIGAIDSLLFTIQLRDERIKELQRIADLAQAFAEQAFPQEETGYY